MPETESVPILRSCPDSATCQGCKRETDRITGSSNNSIAVRCDCYRTSFYYANDYIQVRGKWYTLSPQAVS